MIEIREQNAIRYIVPLREGGSLPALIEADDGFRYVLKFKGGGHGSKALISELIGGEIARAAGFHVPEIVFLEIDSKFGITEPDEEIQDLLKASTGTNLGLHFLNGALNLDPYANPVDEVLASRIVWLDSYILNVDRSFRNTNMLEWNRECWLIDHGSSLYFHHNWNDRDKAITTTFPYIKDHAFIHKASKLIEADDNMKRLITPRLITEIVNLIPDEWLNWEINSETPQAIRDEYIRILTSRLDNSSSFVNHAIKAHNGLV